MDPGRLIAPTPGGGRASAVLPHSALALSGVVNSETSRRAREVADHAAAIPLPVPPIRRNRHREQAQWRRCAPVSRGTAIQSLTLSPNAMRCSAGVCLGGASADQLLTNKRRAPADQRSEKPPPAPRGGRRAASRLRLEPHSEAGGPRNGVAVAEAGERGLGGGLAIDEVAACAPTIARAGGHAAPGPLGAICQRRP